MTRVVIVDDSKPKRDKVTTVVQEALGQNNVTISSVSTVSAAAKLMEDEAFDLLILDINIPLRPSSEPIRDGGLRLLKQLVQGGPRLHRPSHIFGLTEFPDLAHEFAKDFATQNWQVIDYDPTGSNWSDVLTNKVIYIAESIRNAESDATDYKTDIAIITALKPIELEAILRLPAHWTPSSIAGDDTVYHTGLLRRDSRRLSVVCAAAHEMGMPASACLAMKMILHFRPKYFCMAGITAGAKGAFGDIMVADQVWDYGSGKVSTTPDHESAFAPSPNYLQLAPIIKEKCEYFRTNRKHFISQIHDAWPGNPISHVLTVHIGPLASGAAVVENAAAIQGILTHNRKLIGVEMEAYSVFLACALAPFPRPLPFVAKSVCDFGIPPKTDDYQRYAAYTSANFLYEFILDQLAPTIHDPRFLESSHR